MTNQDIGDEVHRYAAVSITLFTNQSCFQDLPFASAETLRNDVQHYSALHMNILTLKPIREIIWQDLNKKQFWPTFLSQPLNVV